MGVDVVITCSPDGVILDELPVLVQRGDKMARTVDAARGTLREHSPVDTWAKLTVVTAEQLDCTTPRQQHAVKMAVTAALLLAQQTEHMDL